MSGRLDSVERHDSVKIDRRRNFDVRDGRRRPPQANLTNDTSPSATHLKQGCLVDVRIGVGHDVNLEEMGIG